MRRSEMVAMIADYLDMRDEDRNIHPLNMDAADYILGCCETFGMSPPLRWKPHVPQTDLFGPPSQVRQWTPEYDDETTT